MCFEILKYDVFNMTSRYKAKKLNNIIMQNSCHGWIKFGRICRIPGHMYTNVSVHHCHLFIAGQLTDCNVCDKSLCYNGESDMSVAESPSDDDTSDDVDVGNPSDTILIGSVTCTSLVSPEILVRDCIRDREADSGHGSDRSTSMIQGSYSPRKLWNKCDPWNILKISLNYVMEKSN